MFSQNLYDLKVEVKDTVEFRFKYLETENFIECGNGKFCKEVIKDTFGVNKIRIFKLFYFENGVKKYLPWETFEYLGKQIFSKPN